MNDLALEVIRPKKPAPSGEHVPDDSNIGCHMLDGAYNAQEQRRLLNKVTQRVPQL